MRILMVGAGAIGGYFGARLVEKGEDVTFLVRNRRKEQLDRNGLVVKSKHGDIKVTPDTIQAGQKAEPFDIVVFTTKAYHLEGAIRDVQDYVDENTMILPLLNGISHLKTLSDHFGESKVLGGLCFVESTLDHEGNIIQTSDIHELVYGERNGEKTKRIRRLEDAFTGTKASFRLSDQVYQEMWHKYLFITTLSGVTSLFRSPIGPIRDSKTGEKVIKEVLSNTATVMRELNAPLASGVEDALYQKLEQMDYEMKSSLQRDMEKGLAVEGDHLYGYLLDAAHSHDISVPHLTDIYANLNIYESIN